MKKLGFLILVGIVFILASCSKAPEVNDNPTVVTDNPTSTTDNDVKTMNDLEVSPSFDWKTYRDVSFSVKGTNNSILEVVSSNGTVYQKAYLSKEQSFDIKVAIPTYENSVKLKYKGQEKTVDISGGSVNHSFQ